MNEELKTALEESLKIIEESADRVSSAADRLHGGIEPLRLVRSRCKKCEGLLVLQEEYCECQLVTYLRCVNCGLRIYKDSAPKQGDADFKKPRKLPLSKSWRKP